MAKIIPLSSNRATQRSAHSQNHRDYDAIADLWKKISQLPSLAMFFSIKAMNFTTVILRKKWLRP